MPKRGGETPDANKGRGNTRCLKGEGKHPMPTTGGETPDANKVRGNTRCLQGEGKHPMPTRGGETTDTYKGKGNTTCLQREQCLTPEGDLISPKTYTWGWAGMGCIVGVKGDQMPHIERA